MDKTLKLYETDGHLDRFEAAVLSSFSDGDSYLTVLDRTAFFPEGGGQACDVGTLGGAPVTDVKIKDGVVYHRTGSALPEGENVCGEVDMSVRFPRMQCHSGEHIVSGLVHKLYGFENVGFHLGSTDTTIDFDGELDDFMLERVEWLANEAVTKNVPVNVTFPSPEELKRIVYRSKLDLTENVRLVEIEGYDVCACCAPHVSRTGEIGIIKFLDHIRYKGGTRLHVQCGTRALLDYRRRYADTAEVARMLSVKQEELPEAVKRLTDELADAKRERDALITACLVEKALSVPETDGSAVFFVDRAFASGLREMVNAAKTRCGGIAAAFAGTDGDYVFVMGSEKVDVREAGKTLLPLIGGRGGGTPEMIRGSASGTEEEIRRIFSAEK